MHDNTFLGRLPGLVAPWLVREVKLGCLRGGDPEVPGVLDWAGPNGGRRQAHGLEKSHCRPLNPMRLETVLIAQQTRLQDPQIGRTEMAVDPRAANIAP